MLDVEARLADSTVGAVASAWRFIGARRMLAGAPSSWGATATRR